MIEQLRDLMAQQGVPADMFWLIVGLAVVQVALQVAALIDLLRRPHVTLGDRKWVWALVIVFGQLIGSVLYFALGRAAYEPGEEGRPLVDRAAAEEKAQRIVDRLYGDKGER